MGFGTAEPILHASRGLEMGRRIGALLCLLLIFGSFIFGAHHAGENFVGGALVGLFRGLVFSAVLWYVGGWIACYILYFVSILFGYHKV
jgi:hypothetical protein